MFRLQVDVPQQYRLSFDKKRVRQVLSRAGAEIAAVARNKIRRSAGGGRFYRGPGGVKHQASLPAQPPTSFSGALANSIRSKTNRNGDGVTIRDLAFYALFLETGAKGGGGSGVKGKRGQRNKVVRGRGLTVITPVGGRVMAPRPFLSLALEERETSIAERIKSAIIEDVQFKRIAAGAKLP